MKDYLSADKILAIIPARGGSKGIPRKNIRKVLGKPLLSYSIEHARQTEAITRVVVSTDDAAVAEVADTWGTEVIWRPSELSGDAATSESALLHALDYLRHAEEYEPSLVVFLQPTSPVRHPDDIRNAINTMMREQADSLFSASPVHGFLWRRDGDRLASLTYDYRHRPRRQDAPLDLIENGSIYVFKPWVLRELNNRLGGRIAVYIMDSLCSFQVDEPDDLELIEKLVSAQGCGAIADSRNIKLLVLDFDGVMTDNHVLVDQHGTESVWCHRGDGWGIQRLKEAGVDVIVLSTEANSVVEARCRKLGITCVQGCSTKLAALQKIARERSFRPEQVAFVGNDVNDLECMRWVGLAVAVADAVPEAQRAAHLITRTSGGQGSVREVCDLLASGRGYSIIGPASGQPQTYSMVGNRSLK